MTLYEQLAQDIARRIESGVLRPGERIPSVRQMRAGQKLSPATVLRAYYLLEDRGLIQSRPRSGYYVSATWKAQLPEPGVSKPPQRSTAVDVSSLVFELLDSVRDREVVPLGSAFPHASLFPLKKLAGFLGAAARQADPDSMIEGISPGCLELRRQIARRYLDSGARTPMDEIVITAGAMEALNLCLRAVTRPGDLVAIESPSFYAALQAVEGAGLRAIEIPTDPRDGVDIAALERALDRHPIKACWFMTAFQNPLGALMPEERKRELVRLLARRKLPLIEDDAYAELHYDSARPLPAKAFDTAGLVLHCGSFSKCLAPGYRVGWAAAGRYAQKVHRGKLMTSIATNTHAQEAIAAFMRRGGYDHHLRALRRTLEQNRDRMTQAVTRHFPAGTRLTRPRGGYFLWVELPAGTDALELNARALEQHISLAPGPMFSPQRRYANCVRLNYGLPWSKRIEDAVATVGGIATRLVPLRPA